MYSVAMVDVTQEMEYWAEWAALASAAHFARYSISCVTSTIATLQIPHTLSGQFFSHMPKRDNSRTTFLGLLLAFTVN